MGDRDMNFTVWSHRDMTGDSGELQESVYFV